MAIAIDISSPARFTGTPANNVDITSASFTPPSNSLLVACVSADTNGNTDNITVSVSGGSLTWTNRIERDPEDGGANGGHASIWTAVQSTSTSMTVSVRRTAGNGSTGRISVKVYVVTGADVGGTPTGATGNNSSNTNDITPNVYTSTADNSRGFGCATDWMELGVPVSTDTEDGDDYSGQISVISLHKAADTATSGSTVTMNFDAGGTGSADWNWVALEVLPDTGPAPQLARPDSDVSTGSWTTTTLFSKVDEASPDDGDLITSASGPSNDTCELGLSDLTDPASSTGHKLRVRRKKSASSANQIDMRYRILEGTTEIASFTDDTNISDSAFTTVERTLSGGQADSITDYTDLRVEIRANQVAGAGTTPTFVGRSASLAVTTTSGADVTPAMPSGHQAGDINIIVAHHSGALGWATPSGWNVISALTGQNAALAQNVAVFWRREVGGDTAPAVSLASPDNVTTVRGAAMYGFRGCISTGDPWDSGSGAGPTRLDDAADDAVIDTTSITTTVANCLVFFVGAYEDDPSGGSQPSGYTTVTARVTATGTDCGIYDCNKGLTGTSTENPSTTLSGGTFANSPHCGILIALKPEPPANVAAQVSWVEFEVPGVVGGGVSLDVTTTASVSTTNSGDVTTTGAVSQSEEIEVTSSAAVSQTGTSDVTTSSALSRTEQLNVTSDAATTRVEDAEVDTTAAVSRSEQAEVNSSGALSTTGQSGVDTDASITVAGVSSADVPTSGALSRVEQAEVETSGALSLSEQEEVSTTGALSLTGQGNVGTDASVTVAGAANADVESTAATSRTESSNVDSEAALSQSVETQVTSSAAASRTEQAEVETSAALSQSAQGNVGTDASISVQGQVLMDVDTSASIGPPASLLIDDRTLAASWVDDRTLGSSWIDSRTIQSGWVDSRII